MGLHSKTRFILYPQGTDRTEQMRDIIGRAVDLFDRVRPVFCPDEKVITRKFARHLSRFEASNLEEEQIRKHFRLPSPASRASSSPRRTSWGKSASRSGHS